MLFVCMAGASLAAPGLAFAVVTLDPIPELSNDTTPTFSGIAALGPDGVEAVTVEITGAATTSYGTTRDELTGAYSVTAAPPLADGTYNAKATQADNSGTSESQTRTFTIDTVAPSITIPAPPGPLGSSGELAFSVDGGASSIECSIDGGGFSACGSPKSYSGLASGGHNLRVRATDGAGNAATVQRNFTVDATPPIATVTGGPNGPTNDTTPSFTFSANEAGSTFECKMDGSGGAGGFAACASPKTYAALAAGPHTFRVRPKDTLGNVGAIVNQAFTIDITAPSTTITAGPAGNTTSAVATFSFTSSESGSTFECRVDGGGWTTCVTPHTFKGLGEGSHTAEIRAIDPAGNTDGSPASRSWTISDLHPPTASFTVAPATVLTGETITFTSTSTDPDNALVSQSWDLDNDGRFNDGSDKVVGRSWPKPGSYLVRLMVVDAQGIAVVAEKTVVIGNRAPGAKISSKPSKLRAGRKTIFTAAATDTDGTVAKIAWDLDGDGKYDDGTGATVSKTFKKSGSAKVAVQVTDELGAVGISFESFSVDSATVAKLAPFPIVRISGHFNRSGVQLSRLLVQAPKGSRVLIRCRGKGCPRKTLRKSVTTRGSAAKSLRFSIFERFLRAGIVLDVRVTKTGSIGKLTRIRVLRGRAPARTDRCLKAGKTVRCPK